MGLREYKRKRDFSNTPEPSGGNAAGGHIYCIQKHDASHLHYDLRLQLDGVLKSWAVPKGPSLDPHEKRLAVEVEDHPVDYAKFEGTIPKGYGAGEVLLWDYGTWEPLEDPHKGLKKGHLDFEINGEKLHGRWVLVRTRTKGGKPKSKQQWLLIKRTDSQAKSEDDYVVTEQEKESVLSGKRLARDQSEEVAVKKKTVAKPKKTKSAKLKLDFIEPQLAQLAKTPPLGSEWIHEVKFDGYRTISKVEGGRVKMMTRKGLNWTHKYQKLADEMGELKVDNAIFDGEVVALDEHGRSDFQLLQETLKDKKTPIIYYVFDLLALNGEDLRERPLSERKELLKTLLDRSNAKRLVYSEHWSQKGSDVLHHSCIAGLEGVISKDKNAPYFSGRGHGWIKSKCTLGQEFIICGYTKPEGSRLGFGSLLLGACDDNKKLVYTGRVGTGFDQKLLRELMKQFKPVVVDECPFTPPPPDSRGVQWLEPKLVCEVSFMTWTREKVLRHASFKGLRLDKPANEVFRDKAVDAKKLKATSKPTKTRQLKEKVLKLKKTEKKFALSNPAKVLIAKAKVTKQDISDYYAEIHKWMLPHLIDRPLSLVRCPDGIDKQCFFQKNLTTSSHANLFQDNVKGPKGKNEHLIYLNSPEGLQDLTQMGVLEIHVWGTHRDHFLKPDQIVFDLDPGPGVKWDAIVDGALMLRELLKRLKIKSFVKSSGGKGLHVQFPIVPEQNWEQVKNFTKTMAQYMAHEKPDLYLAVMAKQQRKGRIFIDYLRNGYGATAIAPYSLRARDEAGIALPLEWDDIADIHPTDFTIKNAAKVIAKRKRDPWAGYIKLRQRISLSEIEESDMK
jgi:bifunctional non-homologous end joining protein LigD